MTDIEPMYQRISAAKIDPSRPTHRHNYNITDFFWNYEEISKIPGPKAVNPNYLLEEQEKDRTIFERITDYFMMSNPSHWIFLVLMAFITTTISIGIEYVVKKITEQKIHWAMESDLAYSYRLLIWVGSAWVLTLIATSVGE